MAEQQFISLMAPNGTVMRVATRRGAPIPTTGEGSIVFSDRPTLRNLTLNNASFTGAIAALIHEIAGGSSWPISDIDVYVTVNKPEGGGDTTLILPNPPSTNQILFFSDVAGTVNGSQRIILDGNGRDINGAATLVLDQPYSAVSMFDNGTDWTVRGETFFPICEAPVSPLSVPDFDLTTAPVSAVSPNAIVVNDGQAYLDLINPGTGEFPGLVSPTVGLNLAKQKRVGFANRTALAKASLSDVQLVLTCMEATMSYRNGMILPGPPPTFTPTFYGAPTYGPDGSFPGQKFGTTDNQSHLHNKMIACDNVIGGLYEITQTPFYTGAEKVRVDALIVSCHEVATYFASTYTPTGANPYGRVLWKFFADCNRANQIMSTTVFIHTTGVLAGDASLVAVAQTLMERIFTDLVSFDGIFLEKIQEDGIGFDGVYDSFSLELLTRYWSRLPNGTWRDTVYAKLVLGINRWMQTINTQTGLINDAGWTRTTQVGVDPGIKVVDYDRDVQGLRIYEWGNFTGPGCIPGVDCQVLGARTLRQGQRFDHDDDDGE